MRHRKKAKHWIIEFCNTDLRREMYRLVEGNALTKRTHRRARAEGRKR